MHCPPRHPDPELDQVHTSQMPSHTTYTRTDRLCQTLRTVPSDSDSGTESTRGAQTALSTPPLPDPEAPVVCLSTLCLLAECLSFVQQAMSW